MIFSLVPRCLCCAKNGNMQNSLIPGSLTEPGMKLATWICRNWLIYVYLVYLVGIG